MGYEQKFYIVNTYENNDGYAEVLAAYNYCKDYDLAGYVDRKGKPTSHYIYADNGNDKITEDCYGEPLQEIEIKDLVTYFKKTPDDYRRRAPFVALLRAFQKEVDKGNFKRLVVLRYGY